MYKVKFKYWGLLFPSWHVVPMTFKTRKEAEKMVECIFDQKSARILDVRIEEI